MATPKKPTSKSKHVTITDDTGTPHTVPRLEYHEFKEVMGVYQAPSGNMRIYNTTSGKMDQLLKMKANIADFTRVLTNKYLPPRLVFNTFWDKLWPALKYPLPALSTSKQECDALMKSLYKHLLPSLKIIGCLPLEYCHGTIKYKGYGFPNLHLEQTIERLQFFMMHISTSILVGHHMRHTS